MLSKEISNSFLSSLSSNSPIVLGKIRRVIILFPIIGFFNFLKLIFSDWLIMSAFDAKYNPCAWLYFAYPLNDFGDVDSYLLRKPKLTSNKIGNGFSCLSFIFFINFEEFLNYIVFVKKGNFYKWIFLDFFMDDCQGFEIERLRKIVCDGLPNVELFNNGSDFLCNYGRNFLIRSLYGSFFRGIEKESLDVLKFDSGESVVMPFFYHHSNENVISEAYFISSSVAERFFKSLSDLEGVSGRVKKGDLKDVFEGRLPRISNPFFNNPFYLFKKGDINNLIRGVLLDVNSDSTIISYLSSFGWK
jgi:hypothetical protein